ALERPLDRASHAVFVLHQKDRGWQVLRHLVMYPRDVRGELGLRRVSEGKEDLERRPMARLTVHADMPSELCDDRVRGCETESGTLPHALGGEERLEDLAHRGLVHAVA